MSISRTKLSVSGIDVDLIRKDVKNIHLSVCPPDGLVKLTAPSKLSDDNARLAVIQKLRWIRNKQSEFRQQQRQSERQFIDGESHYFDGERYLLEVREERAKPTVHIAGNGRLRMTVRPGSNLETRSKIMAEFYRAHLKRFVSSHVDDWAARLGVEPKETRIQKMKTRWGSCNPATGRILLNLELAKKPRTCVEYILVHELVHFLERRHNERFVAHMDRVMADWRHRRDVLKSLPLAYETWAY